MDKFVLLIEWRLQTTADKSTCSGIFMVHSDGHFRAQIFAPDAEYVQLDFGGVKYDMIKDETGVWMMTNLD